MRILVTGGAGFIGSHIVDLALARGHDVAVLDDLSSGKRANFPSDIPFYQVDVRDKARTFAAFSDFSPEAVSHQAAQASVSVSMRDPALDATINIIGGLNVAEAAKAVGCKRFVFASTGGAIYGNIPVGAAAEDYPQNPISPYAINKLAFEMLLGVYAAKGTIEPRILRYANVYGPRQDPHGEAGVVAIFLAKLAKNEPLRVNAMRASGDDGCVRDYVYVSDVARANVEALEGRVETPVMNLGTSVPTSTLMLAQTLSSLCPSSTSQLEFGPPREGDVERSLLDGKLYEKLGQPYVDLATGMAQTARWYLDS